MTTHTHRHEQGECGGVAAEIAQMRRRVAELVDTLWAACEPDGLRDLVAEVEALKATLDALELGVVRELEATGAVKPRGWATSTSPDQGHHHPRAPPGRHRTGDPSMRGQ